MEENFCKHCGKKSKENDTFCENCGTKIKKTDAKQCVWCKQDINYEATVCPFCKRNPNSKTGDRIALIVIGIIIFIVLYNIRII